MLINFYNIKSNKKGKKRKTRKEGAGRDNTTFRNGRKRREKERVEIDVVYATGVASSHPRASCTEDALQRECSSGDRVNLGNAVVQERRKGATIRRLRALVG